MVSVLVLGASNKADRYSYKAVKLLEEHGHKVIAVNPAITHIDGLAVKHSLIEVQETVDSISVYLNPETTKTLIPEILALKPRRIILNPGSENSSLAEAANKAGIEVLEACTLVLLKTGRF